MRFLRGLGVGALGFGFWMVASIFGALSFIGEQDSYQEYDPSLVNPIWMFMIFIGFIIMVGGPIYYWVIEPFRNKRHTQQQFYAGARLVPRSSTGQVASFCGECGTQNTYQGKFCIKCGANLSLP